MKRLSPTQPRKREIAPEKLAEAIRRAQAFVKAFPKAKGELYT